jgi:hypothetical protein
MTAFQPDAPFSEILQISKSERLHAGKQSSFEDRTPGPERLDRKGKPAVQTSTSSLQNPSLLKYLQAARRSS